jgi:acetate kinase
MCFTPLEGLVIGTRCGDVDPACYPYYVQESIAHREMERILNKESG